MGTITAGERAAVRATVFAHLAGIVLIPTVRALWEAEVFQLFRSPGQWICFDEIARHTRANRGYLRVALRILVACGWLAQNLSQGAPVTGETTKYTLTPEGEAALGTTPHPYLRAACLIPHAARLDQYVFEGKRGDSFAAVREFASADTSLHGRTQDHLNGLLAGPAMVMLARRGVLSQLESGGIRLTDAGGDPERVRCVLEFLARLGWLNLHSDGACLTPAGRYAANIAASYGVTVSYLPMLAQLGNLLFGDPGMPRSNSAGTELLVDRAMNVWGSGGAHRTYFSKVDEIVADIFNRPLESQPAGICDMGCGDGSFLEHLYSVVRERTLRGEWLDIYPLLIVGADFNQAARNATKETLERAGIPGFHVIHGDINDPEQLSADLWDLGLDSKDLLHVRSFLDHNRPYLKPEGYVPGTRASRSSGAFARLGEEIPADALEENLVRHLHSWTPHASRFGLLVLELHTLAPQLSAANLDRTPTLAYDGTHGYSDQYLVELPLFLDCAREAGLRPDSQYQAKFPNSEIATVSINLFRSS